MWADAPSVAAEAFLPARFQDCANPQTTRQKAREQQSKKDYIARASYTHRHADSPLPAFRRGQVIRARNKRIRTGDWACGSASFLKIMALYFFFAVAFGAGLAGAFAYAFFLSLPCELLPLAIVKSFREMCCASTTACCTYHNKFAPPHPPGHFV